MSQSETRKSIQGLGTCVAYSGKDGMDIGLPIVVDENRPLVIAHPAAARHYHASMSLFEDAGHPFIHVLIDHYSQTPDSWPFHVDGINHAPYQRLNDTSRGWPVYRKTSIRTPHWQIHAQGDAYEYLTKSPAIDILYVDWLTWLDRFIKNKTNAFPEMMANFSDKIRDGGLVILDHKHMPTDEYGPSWYNHPGGVFQLNDSTSLSEECVIEWIGLNANNEMQTYCATVFKVHHNENGDLGGVNWFEAIQPWLWNTVLEMALMPSQVGKMLDEEHEETIHPGAMTWENWHDTWSSVYMDREDDFAFKTPIPARFAWPSGAYLDYLQWLIEHPKCLPKNMHKRSYRLKGENFKLNIVHGDLIELAPSLHTKHTALAVRYALQQQVIARCPWWKNQATVLQTKEKWMTNAIVGLKWSGPSATSDLAKLLIVQAKQQSFGVTLYNSKPFECREIVTVSHGNAQLEEVMIAVEAYYNELGFNAPRPPYMLELTVVSRDEWEYQEISLPNHWERSDIDER